MGVEEHEKPWRPFTPDQIARLFAGADFEWWLAGGYGLEKFAGRSWRDHGDIDVLILRRDHQRVRRWLHEYDCWAADPPGRLRIWPVTQALPPAVHDIFCRETETGPWRFQIMIDESRGGTWISRRDPRIMRDISSIGLRVGGVPILSPEIQLFYKAKSLRAKDEQDFALVRPLLADAQRAWLIQAIATVYGQDHPWLAGLTEPPNGST